MLFEQRRAQIMSLLSTEKTVSIQTLVDKLNVSESTLRRDLISLEKEGVLSRVHGGATLNQTLGNEEQLSHRININQSLKGKIAEYCSRLVKENNQIYVDAGTATLELIRILPIDQNIHIVTNGVDHALLALQRGIDVMLLGGSVKPKTHAITGITAYQQLSKINFEHVFIGMNGISLNFGLTTTNIDEATLKEKAMEQGQVVHILMDESKINQIFEFKVDAPKKAIILLNEKAKEKAPQSIEDLREEYNLRFVKEI